MAKSRTIWHSEVKKADQIAHRLLEDKRFEPGWRMLLLPFFLPQYIGYRRRLRVTRKNILFTKKLALTAAKNLQLGKNQAGEMEQIETKTREILNKHTKGLYTEDVRQQQLTEIACLIGFYAELLKTNQKSYASMVTSKFPSKEKYLGFLYTLQKAEAAVLQASIATVRRGTKRERRIWFEKLKKATKEIRMAEADLIFAGHPLRSKTPAQREEFR